MADNLVQSLSAIRFGYGLREGQRPIGGAEALMAQVTAHRNAPNTPKIGTWEQRVAVYQAFAESNRAERMGVFDEDLRKAVRADIYRLRDADFAAMIELPMRTDAGFPERLMAFWANHFSVSSVQGQRLALAIPDYLVNAIRPNITGKFADLLKAAILHPAMLLYLDQSGSIGPGSKVGLRRGRGLNENLARELLELHTLGVGADYGQKDVRQMAELLTGLQATPEGFAFKENLAEPGAEIVLGKSYGDDGAASVQPILDALDDLARHPATAAHIARKLAVHFVSEDPPPALVAHIQARFRATDGDLMAVYQAMVEHPSAWGPELRKVKPPLDYMISAARAVGLKKLGKNGKEYRANMARPLISMGQPLMRAPGPDGWPEEAAHWVTPATLAARIEWAAKLAQKVATKRDPRAFVRQALGPLASKELMFAARGAETKSEGVIVVLVSPEFNRR